MFNGDLSSEACEGAKAWDLPAQAQNPGTDLGLGNALLGL